MSVESIKHPISFMTTKEINGPWTAKMQIEIDDYITPESYIGYDNEEYIVKKLRKIKDNNKMYFDVSMYHIMSELADQTIDRFWIKDTTENHVDYILADTNWSAGTVETLGTVTLKVDGRQSVLDTLYDLTELIGGELNFNSATRTVDLKREIGTITHLQLRMDKNVNVLDFEEDSFGLVTRIFPYGPDNLSTDTVVIDNMDNAESWTCSGSSNAVDVTVTKMEGSGSINFIASDGETMTKDLGAGSEIDLSGKDTLTLWIYDNTGSGLDFDANPCYFGIGEAAWDDNKLTITGTVNADSFRKIELDISGVADADKNAIRYIGFESGGEDLYIDDVRAEGTLYIDSDYRADYKVNKEYIYSHSAYLDVAQKTVKNYSTADCYGAEDYPTITTGERSYIKVRDRSVGNDDYEAFIKSDLSDVPANATIIEAKLYLYFYRAENDGYNTGVHLVTADWDEDTLTWNNKPAYGASLATLSTEVADGYGWKNCTITSTVQDWIDGTTTNYGLALKATGSDASQQTVHFWSKENYEYRPYILITYTLAEDNAQFVRDAAQSYLADNDEVAVRYKITMADLSRAIVDTWEDDTIALGDAVRLYDSDFDINTTVRVKRIIEDKLNPANTEVELTNRAYDITDTQSQMERKIKKAMPFEDKKIIDANAIQEGFIGGKVG